LWPAKDLQPSESLSPFLDEPDTHLENPPWAVDYIKYLRTFAGHSDSDRENSHIVITTHNPLAIAELSKSKCKILRLSKDGLNLPYRSHRSS